MTRFSENSSFTWKHPDRLLFVFFVCLFFHLESKASPLPHPLETVPGPSSGTQRGEMHSFAVLREVSCYSLGLC